MKTISRYLQCTILSSLVLFLISFPVLTTAENKLNPAIPLLLLEDSTDDSPRLYDIDEVVETILNNLGEDDSSEALFLAMDKGYSLRQIVEGIMSRGLEVTGEIKDTTGSVVNPEYPPAGIIKTNYTGSVSQVVFSRPITSEEANIIDLRELIAQGKKVAGSLGYNIAKILFKLRHCGYSHRQLFEGIMFHNVRLRYRETRGTIYIKEVIGIFDGNYLLIVPEWQAVERVFDKPEVNNILFTKTVYQGHDKGKRCPGGDLYIGTMGDKLTYCYEWYPIQSGDVPQIGFEDSSLLIDERDIKDFDFRLERSWHYETTLDSNLTNCASVLGEWWPSDPKASKGLAMDTDCARVVMAEDAEFPYLDVGVSIRWNKDLADLGVAACLNDCSYSWDGTTDFYHASALGYVSQGIHKAGTYELAVWIYALKPVVINNPDPDPINVELELTVKPYKEEVPADPEPRKVYDDETKSILSKTFHVEVNKYGSDLPIRNNGYKGQLGTITVRKP